MGKHSSKTRISYWEARRRKKDLRKRGKPPKRASPVKKRWFVLFLLIGFLVGGALGFYHKQLLDLGARIYLSIKEGQWQPTKKEKKEVEKSLSRISPDPSSSVNTIILGSDTGSNKGESGWCRSDVMMLVCLQERDKKAVVLSIPRDTRVDIPGHGINKINAALAYGGPSGAIDIVKQFTGIDVHHYVWMDFDGFARIVNAIGGVPIHLSKPINDPHAGYLPAGDQVLDGWEALVLVRSRKLPGGDIDRIRSQHAFLRAFINKAYKMRDVWKAKQIVDILASACKMDYNASGLTTLAEELRSFPIDDVQFVTVPGDAKMIGGISYFIPNLSLLSQLTADIRQNTEVSDDLLAKLQTYETEAQGRVEEVFGPEADVITVLAGSKNVAGAVPVIAEGLRLMGHQKVFEGSAGEVHDQTLVIYHPDAKEKAESLKNSMPELQAAGLVENIEISKKYNSPVVIVLGKGFSAPPLLSIYGRIVVPALNIENLGEKINSFT
ncbi:MAG: LCP family protein [Actinomycetota bacterium]|nr:LCP family protein [Actinomycetota bacterium]